MILPARKHGTLTQARRPRHGLRRAAFNAARRRPCRGRRACVRVPCLRAGRIMRFCLRLIVAVTIVTTLSSTGHAQGPSGEPFYKGKTLRLIISVGVAGGFGEY